MNKKSLIPLAIGTMLVVTFVTMRFSNKKKHQHLISAKKNIIKDQIKKESELPFPNIELSYEKFDVDPTKDNILTTKEGSIIKIYANTLVRKGGELVKNKVQIKYKEFRDMIDAFLTGTSMCYDSVGKVYHFESAGMFDLQAFDKGDSLFVKKGKEVEVSYASTNKNDGFNLYKYNKRDKSWTYLSKDQSIKKDPIKKEKMITSDHLKKSSEEINELEKRIGKEPVKATEDAVLLEIEANPKHFPELAVFKGLKFQLLNPRNFESKLSSIQWDNIVVGKVNEDTYKVTFYKGALQRSFSCIPVYNGQDYEFAKQEFERRNKKALEELEKKNKRRKKLLAEYEKMKAIQRASFAQARSFKRAKSEAQKAKDKVMRLFKLNSFGIYNSDAPHYLPEGKEMVLKLKDKEEVVDDSLLKHGNVFLVEQNRNCMYTYYSTSSFRYDPLAKNILWTVTEEGKLAVCSIKDFERFNTENSTTGTTTMEMKVIPEKIIHEEQVRKYIQI